MRVRRNPGSSALRLFATLTIAAMFAAGCGGGDDDASSDEGTEADGVEETTAEDGGSDDAASDDADDGGSDGDDGSDDGGDDAPVDAPAAGSATVTIGDTTYVADQQVVCVQIGGALGGSWNDATGDIAISIDLPPADWEDNPDDWSPPSVRIDDDSDPAGPLQFQANAEMATMLNLENADASTVTNYSVDGSSASGTGTFVEFFGSMAAIGLGEDPPAPVEGSFSLTCE